MGTLVAKPLWFPYAGCEYKFLAIARVVSLALVVGTDPATPTA